MQTEANYTDEIILKKRIRILRQKLRRQKNKIENLEDLLKSLKNKGLLENEPGTIIASNFNGKC